MRAQEIAEDEGKEAAAENECSYNHCLACREKSALHGVMNTEPFTQQTSNTRKKMYGIVNGNSKGYIEDDACTHLQRYARESHNTGNY